MADTDQQLFRMRRRETCRICGSKELELYLDLGAQPPSNAFLRPEDIASEQLFPLEVFLCHDCGLSQLVHVVHSQDIFSDYAYLSSTSGELCRHYAGMVNHILRRVQPEEGALAVDIGANDGITLNCYPQPGMRLLGVEPSSAGAHARSRGFEIVEAFFGVETAADIRASHGAANIVTATNVFAHVDDIVDFAEGIEALLADNGVCVFEFPYVGDMLEGLYFDTVYHEHLSYLGLTPLTLLFEQTGLRMFDVSFFTIGASGPSTRLFVCKNDADFEATDEIRTAIAREEGWQIKQLAAYRRFADRVVGVCDEIRSELRKLAASGKRLGAFAAPAKGNTLLNTLGLGASDLIAVSENNQEKIGRLTPGTHIPIISDQEFIELEIDVALLLAWNYADFFVQKADFVTKGGRFLVPLPTPAIRP